MGGYGSGRPAYGDDKERLSGLPGEGRRDPWDASPWLCFCAPQLKRVGALVPDATRFFSFSGEVVADIPAQMVAAWPDAMRRDIEEVRALFNAPEHRDAFGFPALWVRSHCFGALFDQSGHLKDEPNEEEHQARSDSDKSEDDERAHFSPYLPHELRFWLPRLLPHKGVGPSARSSNTLLPGEPQPVSFSVGVQNVPCHFGGFKSFLLCPQCGKRTSGLYLEQRHLVLHWNSEGRLAWMLRGDGPCCRTCGGWTYQSQNERECNRAYRRITKAQLQLIERGAPPPEHPARRVPQRPKGMHFDTHNRFGRIILQADAQIHAYWMNRLGQIQARGRAEEQKREQRAKKRNK